MTFFHIYLPVILRWWAFDRILSILTGSAGLAPQRSASWGEVQTCSTGMSTLNNVKNHIIEKCSILYIKEVPHTQMTNL